MLHVFNVNHGSMWTFDVNLAMERVLELKAAISESQHISLDDQVMLVSSGEALSDAERVCAYSAGTETNPVFFFDRASIENDTLPALQTSQSNNDFTESVRHALALPPCYKTVTIRTNVAMQLNESTKNDVKLVKATIQDKRLMSQGWQAAVNNLNLTHMEFQKRYPTMVSQCKAKLHQTMANSQVYEGMEDTLTILSLIPILPALLKDGDLLSVSLEHDQSQVSLLHWIEANCKNVSLKIMLGDCKQKQEYLSQERLQSMVEACEKAEAQTENKRLIEIAGLKERFAALESFVETAEQLVADQVGIAKGFMKNCATARSLQDHSSSIDAMLTLCESHMQQLKIMVKNEAIAKDSLQQCINGKNELVSNLHRRLRWLYIVQKKINEADASLSMFLQQLTSLERQNQFLAQVKLAPGLYLSSLTEVVRRRHFKNAYLKWVNKAIVDAKAERDNEIMKRETFQSNIAGHFIQKLFRGFFDKPPSLASQRRLSSFDDSLPDVTEDQLLLMSKLLPNYKDMLKVSSSDSGLTSASSTISNDTSSVQTSAEQMEGASPPKLQSESTSMASSHTGSFAVVESATISHSQPSNTVPTSTFNEKDSLPEEKSVINSQEDQEDLSDLPQRAYSSVTLTNESLTHSQSDNENEFARFGDMSVGSPPDSEFFSILPRQFDDGSSPQFLNQKNLDAMSASPVVIPESFDSSELHQRRNSGVYVGSIDSNSFQKVDGLSSDDEMFHSITDDQQDFKTSRKKLQKLQSDYDKLLETSTQEKEDLSFLIKKLRHELETQQKIQQTTEEEFEKQWDASKTELNDLIKQLEMERLEKQKACDEGSDFEKRLEMATEQYAQQEGKIHKMKQEISAKSDQLRKLQNDLADNKRDHEAELVDKMREVQELAIKKDDEITDLKSAIERMEKKLMLSQSDLTTADDRIQELEDLLSERDRKEQEDAERVLAYEGKVNELSNQLKFAFESQQKSSNEKDEATSRILESEAALVKANEQISSLTKLIADGETKFSEYRKTIETLHHFQAASETLKSEKSLLEEKVQFLKSEIDGKEAALRNMEEELNKIQSIAKEKSESYEKELSEIETSHLSEIQSLCKRHEDYIEVLNGNFVNERHELVESSKKALYNKEQEWRKLIEETSITHRNEMDEHEADRLAEYSLAQKEIGTLQEELNEISEHLAQEKRDAAELKDGLSGNIKDLEEECNKLMQDREKLLAGKTDLEGKLSKAENEVQCLLQQHSRESKGSSQTAMNTDTDEEREFKRSRVDSGSLVDGRGSSVDIVALEAGSSGLALAHQRKVDALKENFRRDKLALESIYKKREEAAARRSQVVFNSAIQRLSATKDLQIKTLQEQLMVQSQMNPSTLSQSMTVPSPQMTMSMIQPAAVASDQQVAAVQSASEAGSSQTPDISRDKDRVTVVNFKPGDTVLVCFNDMYKRFTLFTISRTLHFIHQDSIDDLGLNSIDHDSKKTMTFAVLLEKEYCQARKAQNRFGIPVNTKFYRVRVSPFLKKG